MSGKVKSLHGVYKALGRDAFLTAARIYSQHVQKTVEATLSEMESRWYDIGHTITEADKMVSDYNKGFLTRESAEKLIEQERLQNDFINRINVILKTVHLARLEHSLQSPDKTYAGAVLRDMHEAFIKTYGTEYLEDGKYEFVDIPAVIRSRSTGKLCLGIVTLDLESSGEHWGTDFITPYGVVSQGDSEMPEELQKYLRENFIPYDYWYTAHVERDIHVSFENLPDEIAGLLKTARGEQQSEESGYEMKL